MPSLSRYSYSFSVDKSESLGPLCEKALAARGPAAPLASNCSEIEITSFAASGQNSRGARAPAHFRAPGRALLSRRKYLSGPRAGGEFSKGRGAIRKGSGAREYRLVQH